MNDQEHLHELHDAPTLRGLRGKSTLTPPPGADEELRLRVMDRIRSAPDARGHVIPFRRAPLLKGLAAAAILGGVLFLALRPNPVNDPATPEAQALAYELEIDQLDSEDLHVLVAESPDLMPVADGLNEDVLATYLEHRDLPLELILEELPVQ
ncbi:MAG: hypothetical protein MUE88_03845 [Flavobacteriales bacterium]|jgi:hypothetical protein|nr:hypothetical protein [Flavobacteriales bacterium]